MTLYTYEELDGAPNQGYLEFLVKEDTTFSSKFWIDISYHPEENWLKIWFTEALTAEEKTALDGYVSSCLGVERFLTEEGVECIELNVSKGKGTLTRKHSIRFPSRFVSEPSILISNAEFVGAADMQIVKITNLGFNFTIEVNGSNGVSGDIASVSFDWKAWVAE